MLSPTKNKELFVGLVIVTVGGVFVASVAAWKVILLRAVLYNAAAVNLTVSN